MPTKFAACSTTGHDAGDEDPGEPAARRAIKAMRQAWKEASFPMRMLSLGVGCMPGGKPYL